MKENKMIGSQDSSKDSIEERSLRQQVGFYTSPEEIENKTHIEDNAEYLRSAASMHFDMYEEVIKLCEDFDEERYEEVSREYRERHESLERKKLCGVLKKGNDFSSTYFFERAELTGEEQTVVMQLLGVKGLGVRSTNPSIPGKVIMLTLRMLHDTPVERAWMILNRHSKLLSLDLVKRTEGEDGVEGSYYTISELAVSKLIDFRAQTHMREGSLIHRYMMDSKHSRDEDDRDERAQMPAREEKIDLGPLEKIDSDVCFKNDVILPEDIKEDIYILTNQIQNIDKFESWGMNKLLGEHTGVTVLFSGASGTGKTLTARAIGNLLGKDTYYLSFPKLLSSWYSNTEQNVANMFKVINSLDAVLVLDEADGLLNKRFESRGCADATENRIVTIFLQELERSSAIIVLTTNISCIMDKALDRRFDLKLEFPMPNEDAREKIWYAHLPEKLPLSADVDIPFLAKRYEFSGGQIKNAVLNAVRYAISQDADDVTQKDFVKACEREESGKDAMNYGIFKDTSEDVKGYS